MNKNKQQSIATTLKKLAKNEVNPYQDRVDEAKKLCGVYGHIILNQFGIAEALKLQYMVRNRPETVNIPPDFNPQYPWEKHLYVLTRGGYKKVAEDIAEALQLEKENKVRIISGDQMPGNAHKIKPDFTSQNARATNIHKGGENV